MPPINYTLRPYQQKGIDIGVDYLRSTKNKGAALEIWPTGSGKSLLFANVAKEMDGEPMLILQPSLEILQQNYQKYCSYGFNAGVYSASVGRKDIQSVTFAMIGSIKNQTEISKQFKYVCIDEAHVGMNPKQGMMKTFLESIGKRPLLGATATPYRLSNDGFGGAMLKFLTRTRPRFFKDVIYHIQNKELFDAGYLAKLEYFSVSGFDRSKLQLNTTGTDYTDLSVHSYLKSSGFTNKAVKSVKRLLELGRKNVLVFTRFVDEARYIASQIEGATVVTGDTPKAEREEIINGFKSGKIKVVLNVGVLTTGFDYPELETIVIFRPTLSLALYYQMIGRGIRPHPNKKSAWIIDLCGNLEIFGKVEDLWLNEDGGKWNISSNGKQLTNVYFNR